MGKGGAGTKGNLEAERRFNEPQPGPLVGSLLLLPLLLLALLLLLLLLLLFHLGLLDLARGAFVLLGAGSAGLWGGGVGGEGEERGFACETSARTPGWDSALTWGAGHPLERGKPLTFASFSESLELQLESEEVPCSWPWPWPW